MALDSGGDRAELYIRYRRFDPPDVRGRRLALFFGDIRVLVDRRSSWPVFRIRVVARFSPRGNDPETSDVGNVLSEPSYLNRRLDYRVLCHRPGDIVQIPGGIRGERTLGT